MLSAYNEKVNFVRWFWPIPYVLVKSGWWSRFVVTFFPWIFSDAKHENRISFILETLPLLQFFICRVIIWLVVSMECQEYFSNYTIFISNPILNFNKWIIKIGWSSAFLKVGLTALVLNELYQSATLYYITGHLFMLYFPCFVLYLFFHIVSQESEWCVPIFCIHYFTELSRLKSDKVSYRLTKYKGSVYVSRDNLLWIPLRLCLVNIQETFKKGKTSLYLFR